MDCISSRLGALALGLSLFLAASAFGQVSQRIYFDVPFDFVAAEKTFPAGEYEIGWTLENRAIVIRSADYKQALIVLTNGIEATHVESLAKVVFHRYGASPYFLSEVWKGDTRIGSQLPMPPAERSLAKASRHTSLDIAAARKAPGQPRSSGPAK